MKVWQCSVCKYIHRGDEPPEKCPICGVDASKFIEIDEADIPVKKPKAKLTESKKEEPKASKEEEQVLNIVESNILKHHLHPLLVHIPNGTLPIAVFLLLASWILNYDLFSKAGFINLVFILIALPLVIYTGVVEWKKKYNGAMTNIFKLKILAAAITSASCAISLVWFLLDPKVLSSPQALIFILINIIMLICAGIAGYIGGKLVFKD